MVIDSHPGPSSPDGDEALVLRAPTAAALRFIAATATCCPPSMSASMFAASLPDTIRSASSSWRVVYGWPGSNPTQEHSTSVWDWLARAKLSGRRLSSTTIASSGLIVLAGACCADGSREARMRPESRSASSHAWAGTVGESDRAGRLDTRLGGSRSGRPPRSSRTRARLPTQPTSFARALSVSCAVTVFSRAEVSDPLRINNF